MSIQLNTGIAVVYPPKSETVPLYEKYKNEIKNIIGTKDVIQFLNRIKYEIMESDSFKINDQYYRDGLVYYLNNFVPNHLSIRENTNKTLQNGDILHGIVSMSIYDDERQFSISCPCIYDIK